ncbi:MAG: hypothetical protein ACREMH_05655 [Gemmatimonadales bacterium]
MVAGTCHATFAFEVGQHIDLERCAGALPPAERQQVRSRRRLPQYFEYQPPPLRLPQEPPVFDVAGLSVSRVDVVLYDFGAAAVNYILPFEGDLASLVPVSVALQDTAALAEDARARLERLVPALENAIERPQLTDMVEDYLIFQVDRLPHGFRPGDLWQGPSRDVVARLLRGADHPLATEEVEDAVGLRLSWTPDDLTIVDWNAALVCDPDPEETTVLLEFANVQLLELRHLDRELDEVVEQAYAALGRSRPTWWHALRPPVTALRRLSQLQVDSAVLFERVSNAVKLVGDRFLGRVYLAASHRFHFADWDQAIARKLAVTEGIYQKLSDRVTARRLEVLEWIVILLIAFEVVFGLLQ